MVDVAQLSESVNIGSVAANSTLDVQVAAPNEFRYDRPVLVMLDTNAAALNAGLLVQAVGRVVNNSGKKIEFRVINTTAGALDPAALTIHFFQV